MYKITRDPRSIVFVAIVLCIVASLTGARGEDKNAGGLKIASVNPGRLLSEYKFTKSSNEELTKTKEDTITALQAWNQNDLLSDVDQQALGDLIVQEATPAGLNPAQKAQKQKLLDQSKALFDEMLSLQGVQNPNAVQQARYKVLVKAEADTKKRVADKQQGVEASLNQKFNEIRAKIDKDVHDAVNKVGKAKGFNLVFSSEVLLYSDNDITDDVLKELNK